MPSDMSVNAGGNSEVAFLRALVLRRLSH